MAASEDEKQVIRDYAGQAGLAMMDVMTDDDVIAAVMVHHAATEAFDTALKSLDMPLLARLNMLHGATLAAILPTEDA